VYKVPPEKILVLSDVHYPRTDVKEILTIIRTELPDKMVILGDSVYEPSYFGEFKKLLQTSACQDFAWITGDSDPNIAGVKSLKLVLNGREFLFLHGHQFNVWSERFTKEVTSLMKKIHRRLPVLGFAASSRVRSKGRSSYLILGHTHALNFYPRLKVACAGCLTTEKNLYNDRGYIVITAAENGKDLELSLNRCTGEKSFYRIPGGKETPERSEELPSIPSSALASP
jgi:uncharacterized protein